MAGKDERTLSKMLNIPMKERSGPQKEDFTFTDKEVVTNQYGGVKIMIKDDFESVRNVAQRTSLYERKSGTAPELNNQKLMENLKKRQELIRKDYLNTVVNVESPKSVKKSGKNAINLQGKIPINQKLKKRFLNEMDSSKPSYDADKHANPIRKEMVNKISKSKQYYFIFFYSKNDVLGGWESPLFN